VRRWGAEFDGGIATLCRLSVKRSAGLKWIGRALLTRCKRPTLASPVQIKRTFRLGDLDEAAGAAAYGEPSIVGVADIVWVTEKGDSCDPFTPDDAGGTSASELLEEYDSAKLSPEIHSAWHPV
jgi:hypothetical protein